MKRFYWFIYALIISANLYATDLKSVKFDHITVDNGLSQNTVELFFQDSKGFIWIGTRDGINKFDGINFEVFRNDRNDTNSLASNWITAIGEDRNGNIWIGSDGLNVFSPETNKLKRFRVETNNPDGFKGGKVNKFWFDKDNTVWIATNAGLAHYFPDEDKFFTYRHDNNNPNSIPANIVFDIFVSEDDRMFIALDTQDAIFEFDRKTGKFTRIDYKQKYFGNNYRKKISGDNDGNLYIGSENGGIHIYNLRTKTVKLLDNVLNNINVQTHILKFSDSEIWIGTDGGGINVYNPLDNSVQFLVSDTKNPYSLHGDAVFNMFRDKDGNIWVGHYGTGISLYRKNKEKFVSYSHNPFDDTSLGKGVVAAVFEDSEGRIWIGNDGGGLNLFNPFTGTFRHFRYEPGNAQSLSTDVIVAIQELPDKNLLLGTYSGGLMVFDPLTEKVIKVYNSENGLSAPHTWYILPDSKGNYWLAMLGTGIDVFNPRNNSFTFYPALGANPRVCSNVIMNITEDHKGRIWLGSENVGICILDQENDTVIRYRFNAENPNSLSNNNVKSIIFIDNYAWIATNGGGLNRLDLKTDSFKIYTTSEGFSSDALMGMLTDREGNLWISSTKGLMKFNPKTEKVVVFDKSQGLQGNEFKYNAQWKLSDGRMIFGGAGGITIFNPDSIKPSPVVPSVVFTGFRILNSPVQVGVKGSPLKKCLDATKYLKLKHKHSVFTFEFASLDYTTPEKNQYKYKLDGFDKDWVYAGNKNFATYTNIDPGVYYFRLMGSNSDGEWNPNERVIKIRVRPPWYRTKIFLFLVICGIVYLVWQYIKLREKQSRQDKIVLQEKIDEGRKQLQQKIDEIENQKEEIRVRDESQREIRYQIDGIAKFSDIIAKKRRDIEDLSTGLISDLVEYVGANAGVIYVLNDSDLENPVLQVSGQYCYDTNNEKRFEFAIGEGYIGACFEQAKTIEVDNLSEGFIVLRSGLGDTSLKYCIYVPVINEKNCLGVIEIASLEPLPQYKISFIEKIADNFASVLAITKANERTKEMLEQNRIQSEELMAQEEELRQNLEEMQATQEDLRRQMENAAKAQEALEKEKALIDTLLKYSQQHIYFKDKESKFIKVSNSMIKNFNVSSVEEIYGKSDFDFFATEHAQQAYDDEMEIIKTGKPILNKVEKETRPDGTITYVSTSKMPLYDHKKQIIGTFGISTDISNLINMEMELKQRNEELQAQEEELRQNLEEMQAVQDNLQEQIQANQVMQDSLVKEKALLDAIMNNLPDYIYFKDKDSKFIRISKSMLPLFPVETLEEMIGKSDFDFHTPENAQRFYDDEMDIIRSGKGFVNQLVHEILENGVEQWVATTKLPLYDENNNCIGTFGTSKNVTDIVSMEAEIKQRNEELLSQEEELRQNLEEMQAVQDSMAEQIKKNDQIKEQLVQEKALLDALMDNLPDYIYFKDINSKFIRISKSMLPLFPVGTLQEMIGKSDFDFHTHENAQKFYNDEMQIIQSGQGFVDHLEHEIIDNGIDQWVSTTKLPLYDETGKCIGTFGISKNITELKRQEIAAQELVEKLNLTKQELETKISSIQQELKLKNEAIKELEKKLKSK
ncbi:MAG: PAS domain-containing protein [Bacteroidales bacterium]|nr:PAS domain-containing protein [Bacteroidales bacterium]